MAHQAGTDKEYDLDLDNRKMVLIFFVFLAICGCFFVAGYIMGNKSDSKAANYADTGVAGNSKIKDNFGIETSGRNNEIVREQIPAPYAVTEPISAQPEIPVPSAAVSNNAVTDAVQQEPPEIAQAVSVAAPPAVSETPVSSLSSNTPEPQPKAAPNKTAAGTADEKAATAVKQATAAKVTPPAKQAAAAKPAYSVQVAAFRARREVEIKARELEAKGFEPRIEPPQTPGDYYRLKVGSLATRAEAAELAKQLVEKGFETMITEIK